MITAPFRLAALAAIVFPAFLTASARSITANDVPEPLRPWMQWATWDDAHRNCPTPYNDKDKHLCFWPSKLSLDVGRAGGRFDLTVTVFSETWVPLPGGSQAWPQDVKANGNVVPVIEKEGFPSVQLPAGTFKLEGTYRWNEIPQSLRLPQPIGVLALTLDGQAVESPSWDAQGVLWLKRDAFSEEADKDFLSVKVYAELEDGIPLWLRTQVELIVAGKSREEDLGGILPAGWKLASVNSPLPVMVDDSGQLKAQVRAGKWTISLNAFRLDNPKEFGFSPNVKPAAEEELIAFRAKPDFRMLDIVGSPSIDVSQTPFPGKWRELPVYRWETSTPFRIEERMRGMGQQTPEGIRVTRTWWLDEKGREFTFQDRISGAMQQIWRLDAAEGQDLGSVRIGGQGQLITRNAANNAPGVEIRTRNLDVEATGRMDLSNRLSATGWRADAENINITLNLPPGWRLFALFGADWVRGDWLTAWTLLDLFLLLIFTLSVFRLWGLGAAVLAFVAFGISYHEPGAPRYVWLALLIPLALLQVVPQPSLGRNVLLVWKWLTVAALVLILVPFVAGQVQQALYPQLEKGYGQQTSYAVGSGVNDPVSNEAVDSVYPQTFSSAPSSRTRAGKMVEAEKSNLQYDSKARIQTGPGVPDWTWRTVSFGWNGPVQASQYVHPILISLPLERAISLLRVGLLLALAAVLLRAQLRKGRMFKMPSKAALFLACLMAASSAQAQFPEPPLLTELRDRLLAPSDAYPTAAEIPTVSLTLDGRKLTMEAQIHTAIQTAVPLPGRLPAWAPLSVTVNGKPDVSIRREDGYLWVVLPAGVHTVRVDGLLANVTEWEWTFLLKPRIVTISAPGWTYSGVRPDGVPEQQVFFILKQKSEAGVASYDRQDLQSLLLVNRQLELGLVWQIRTTVSRLSPEAKAVSARIPLLPGENVLSSNTVVKDGFIEVRLGTHESEYTWNSELTPTGELSLATQPDNTWVEQWRLVVSPVWNISFAGLAPTFDAADPELVPIWHPWPGESVALTISRPEAISGATVTVQKATHEISLGMRQRTSTLDLSLLCSLGEDFLIELPEEAEITSLTLNSQTLPVRKDRNRLIIPLRPGAQNLSIGWKTNQDLGFKAETDAIRLPVESANIETIVRTPSDRWILWTSGPLRGPAVRFWSILACSLLTAWALGRIKFSPLRSWQWMLLAIGLTQVPLPFAMIIIGWLFFLVWRGHETYLGQPPFNYNLLQVILVGLTGVSLIILIFTVGAGLLGNPEMFILGNGSNSSLLRWFQPRSDTLLPQPACYSVSLWWYRLLMLGWALWLAASLLRWLRWGWEQFSKGGCFRSSTAQPPPPPIPRQK